MLTPLVWGISLTNVGCALTRTGHIQRGCQLTRTAVAVQRPTCHSILRKVTSQTPYRKKMGEGRKGGKTRRGVGGEATLPQDIVGRPLGGIYPTLG